MRKTDIVKTMEHIDAILYINLASRPDRQEHFLQEIAKLCTDNSKIHLVDAVYQPENGALGCTRSHIKAFNMVEQNPDWKKCIMFEDDFTFRSDDVAHNNAYLRSILETPEYQNWNVISLSYNPIRVDWRDTHSNPNVKKVISTQTTSGYAFTREFMPTLRANFMEAEANMMARGPGDAGNCCDQYWKRLQPNANWYLLTPSLGYQYENFSDIEKRVTAYGC